MLMPARPERPLPPVKRALMVVGASCVLILAYLFISLSFLFVCVIIAALLAFLIPAVRVGMVGSVGRSIRRQWIVVRALFTAVRIRRGAEYGITLGKDEAPGLFELVKATANKIGALTPETVILILDANAWVRLKG